MTAETMSPEAQRIAIATACGWTDIEHRPFAATVHEESQPSGWFGRRAGMMHTALPDFLADLNAMHEAEKVLTDVQWHDYLNWLFVAATRQKNTIDSSKLMLSATADQRAEAFLRTLNKRETP